MDLCVGCEIELSDRNGSLMDTALRGTPHTCGKAQGFDAAVALVTDEVMREVMRARELHAPMNSQHEAYAVILEEMDEFWEQVKINPKKLSPVFQTYRVTEMRKELIQVAAMCVRAILDTIPENVPNCAPDGTDHTAIAET